uniref:Tyrosine-protein phosphatase domain-containing protein n=1 Tax=Meloidogyne incognita TaxID=6306 RepID=A0A914LYP8_MELIC
MICALGPLDRTINDFWSMVSENNYHSTAMQEHRGRPPEATCRMGNRPILVARLGKTTATPTNPKLKRTSLSVTMPGRKPMAVTHYQFDGWPDHNVPLDPGSFSKLRRAVFRRARNENCTVLIHCFSINLISMKFS